MANNGYAPVIGNPPQVLDAQYTIFNSPSQILRFPSTSQFRIFYLEAPLSVLSDALVNAGIINSLVEFNIFHSGIGFQAVNERQPFEFTFDYNIINGFNIQALVPTIVDNEIIWNNQAAPFLGTFIDRDYWNHSTYIATVTGDQLIHIQQWILNTWSPQNPNYVLFSGVASDQRQDLFNPIMRSSDCYDFAYGLINFMKQSLFICIDYAVVSNLTIASLVSSFPGSIVPVDFETNRTEILAFFQGVIDFFDNPAINVSRFNRRNLFSVENDLFSVIQLYVEFYQSLNVIYVFSYLPNGSPGYWRITNPGILIDYIQINIKRSFRALSTQGRLVTDAYSDLIPTCLDARDNLVNETTSMSWIFIIFLIIIIIIIFAIIGYVVYSRRIKVKNL